MTPIGARVGAILKSDETTVHLIGYGTFTGEEIPSDAGEVGEMLQDIGMTNPKIVLDNGDVVWGCECWWAKEDVVKKRIEGLEVISVDMKKVRQDAT